MPENKPLTKTEKIIRDLSDRIVMAQRPIRILDAIKWDERIKKSFFDSEFKVLPPVDRAFYESRPLPYDPKKKIQEFHEIIRDVTRLLGDFSGVGRIMVRMCHEYCTAIHMLRARGTRKFSEIAMDLYGSPEDAFYPTGPKLKDIGTLLADTLVVLQDEHLGEIDIKRHNATQAMEILQSRLNDYFSGNIKVTIADTIISDSSAGAETIKLNKDVLFSDRDLRILEVHEGWVHVGTTLNGLAQPICTFLSKGSPSSAITQEGLGVIVEIITFSSTPQRVKKLTNRLTSIDMVYNGANFIDVFNYFREQKLNAEESYNYTVRVFRGSLPEAGGPFTKDLAYSKGYILIYNYIRLAVKQGLLGHIDTLFTGKTLLEDLQTLTDLKEQGIVTSPRYIPPQFKDLAALSAWMCYSLFLNKIKLDEIAKEYRQILHR